MGKGLKEFQLCDSRRLCKKPQDAQDDVTELFDLFDAHFWGWKGIEFGLPKAVLPSIQKNSAEVNETIDGFELLGLDSQSPQGMADS